MTLVVLIGAQRIAIVTRPASFAVESMSIVDTLETFSGGSVAVARGVSVDVAVALASFARDVAQRIAVKSISTHFAMMSSVTYSKSKTTTAVC